MSPLLAEDPGGLTDLALPAPPFSPVRAVWGLVQVVVACLLAAYLVGWIEDFQRVSQLSAEPPPPLKKVVVTKNEAWERIYRSLAR
ncbi:MAG: hypothetical protein ACE147_01980 [Candidatus Methylomirabilales bacterium]